jgi:hypothetical protein
METKEKYNAGYQQAKLPYNVHVAILRVLEFYIGRTNSIGRGDLVAAIGLLGFRVSEREVRQCINDLRKDGHPICSTGGEGGGYWMAANWDDLNEYLEREVISRISDLSDQARALRKAARQRWGEYSPQKQSSF